DDVEGVSVLMVGASGRSGEVVSGLVGRVALIEFLLARIAAEAAGETQLDIIPPRGGCERQIGRGCLLRQKLQLELVTDDLDQRHLADEVAILPGRVVALLIVGRRRYLTDGLVEEAALEISRRCPAEHRRPGVGRLHPGEDRRVRAYAGLERA